MATPCNCDTFDSNVTFSTGVTLRIQGPSGPSTTDYFSFGGNGNFGIDAPGVVDGRFVVTDGGNVGVGKASPQQKLDVAGTVSCTGMLLGGTMLLFGAIKDSTGQYTRLDQDGCYYAN